MWTLSHLYLTESHTKCLLAVDDWCQQIGFICEMLVLPLEHQILEDKRATAWIFFWAVSCSRIKIYSYGERRILNLLLSFQCSPEAETSSDVGPAEEGCQQVTQRLRVRVWVTVHNRNSAKKRLHKSGTDHERSWQWTRSFKLLAAAVFSAAKTVWLWRFTALIYELACTFMDMWCIE